MTNKKTKETERNGKKKMKKVFAAFIALVLVVTVLASCGGGGSDTPMTRRDEGKTTDGGDETTRGGAQGIVNEQPLSLEVLLTYCETGDTSVFTPHVLSASERDQLRRSVESKGGTVEFSQNGDVTVRGAGASWFTIGIDGSVEGVDDDGMPFGFSKSGTWPDSELGRAIPEAGLEIQSVAGDDENVVITFKNAGYDDMKEYAEKVRAAGFDEDISKTDLADTGTFIFSAENGDGLCVSIMYMASQQSAVVSVEKKGAGDEDTDIDPFYPSDPGTEAELPDEFAFLSEGVTDGFVVLDHDGLYYSIEKPGSTVTLEEAKVFASLCEENGWQKGTEMNYTNADGSEAFFTYYTKDNFEVDVSLNVGEDAQFFVDLKYAGSVIPDIPDGTDDWPSDGLFTLLPKPDFGTGFTVTENSEEAATVTVTGASAGDFETYVQKAIAAGFTEHGEYDTSDDFMMYNALDGKGHAMFVTFMYGVFTIGVGID